jgi:hypothetical protein
VTIDLGEVDTIKSVHLWPLDHGDARQHTHCTEPFVNSLEIDKSFDGFSCSFLISVSEDGTTWHRVANYHDYVSPAANIHLTEQKVKDIIGPEVIDFALRPARFVKIEAFKLRKSRFFGKFAMQLAEIEVIRNTSQN